MNGHVAHTREIRHETFSLQNLKGGDNSENLKVYLLLLLLLIGCLFM
jgi:hypothetical protein